ncbi:hypothetical protein SUDANB54_01541 [Streptomyces sp. enrichment culture]
MRREQKPLTGVRPASKPAHTSTLIGYTTWRDAIHVGGQPGQLRCGKSCVALLQMTASGYKE